MANNKSFKIKNGLSVGTRYLQTGGTETLVVNSFDVQGATYEDKSLSLTQTNPQDLVLNSDGTKMYLQDGGFNADSIYEFSLSTAYDISTATSTGNSFNLYSASFNSRSPQGLGISSDNTKLYSLDDDLNAIYQIDMSTASDLSTASYNSVALTGLDTDGAASVKGFFIGNNGTKLYAVDAVDDLVYQYTLSTAWDISTASYDSVTHDISSLNNNDPFPTDLRFKSDGTKFFVLEASGDSVYSFSLSTAWDVSTASLDSGSLSIPYTNVVGFFIDSSGDKMYLLDNSAEVIYQYSATSRTQTLDLSTGTYFSFTPSGATTVSFTNAPASGKAVGFAVEINGDGSAITWPTSVKWPSGVAPTATASKEVYAFVTTDGGTTYYGKLAGSDIA